MPSCRRCAWKKQNNLTGQFLGCNRDTLEIDDVACLMKIKYFMEDEIKKSAQQHKPQEIKVTPEVNPARAGHTTYLES